MVGRRDCAPQVRLELRLAREPLAHLGRGAVQYLQQQHVVLRRLFAGSAWVNRSSIRNALIARDFASAAIALSRSATAFRRSSTASSRASRSFSAHRASAALSLLGPDQPVHRSGDPDQQREEDETRRDRRGPVPLEELAQAIPRRRRTGFDWLVGQVALDVAAKPLAVWYRRPRSFSSAFITIQSSSPRTSAASLAGSVFRCDGNLGRASQGAEPRAGLGRLLLLDDPADLVEGRRRQSLAIEWRRAGQAARTSSTPRL